MFSAKQLRIIDAARSVFIRHGYRRVTMGDIADAAGISRAALYLAFSKKEDLFRAVIQQHGRQCLDEIRRDLISLKAPKEKLKRAFEIWVIRPFGTAVNAPDAKDLFDFTVDFAQEDREENYRALESTLVPILRPLIKSSPLRISAKQIAHILTSSARGFKLVCRSSDELREMIDSLLVLTLAAIAEPEMTELA
jgi:AcrR family transcriptional regulator